MRNISQRMEDAIPYSGTFSWTLFERAQWRHLGSRWLFFLLIPVLMTAYAYLTSPTLPIVTWLTLLAVSIASIPVIRSALRRQWRRMYENSPYLLDPISGFVSAETFIAESATGKTEMPWTRFVRVREGEDFLLLYPSPYMFHILAREFFVTDQAWEAARVFVLRGAAPAG